MRIDVHAHYWPAAYLDALVDAGRADLARAHRQPDDFDERLAVLDRSGVDLQILSTIGLNVDVAEPGPAAAATRVLNDVNADVARRYPGRFAAFGSVPLPHVEEAIAETERCLGELGAVGVALPCIVDGRPIDHADFEPFWENLARHDAVVYVHPVGSDSMSHPGLDRFGMQFLYGSSTQIGVAPIRILLSGLSTRHPSLRFVFAMCGGTMPFLWPRYERNLRRGFAAVATAPPGTTMFDYVRTLPVDSADPLAGLRRFWYDVAIQDVPLALLAAKESYGADRLVLGSDATFASLDDAVAFVRDSPYLTDEEKAGVLDGNAARMLGPLPALTRS